MMVLVFNLDLIERIEPVLLSTDPDQVYSDFLLWNSSLSSSGCTVYR
jgi:hypothetical protein